MKSRIIGVYSSQDELVESIQELQNEGYPVQELGIIGLTRNNNSKVEEVTDANALTFKTDKETKEDSLIENLANLYVDEDEVPIDTFIRLGMTREEAKEYAGYVEDGRIVLFNKLEEEAPSGGIPATDEETAPNQPMAGYNIETAEPANNRKLK